MTISMAQQVRDTAVKEYNRLRKDSFRHPSHDACAALKYAEKVHNPDTYGVEGTAFDMSSGLSYLNTGETYETTVYVLTYADSARFCVGSWGDYVEANPSKFR